MHLGIASRHPQFEGDHYRNAFPLSKTATVLPPTTGDFFCHDMETITPHQPLNQILLEGGINPVFLQCSCFSIGNAPAIASQQEKNSLAIGNTLGYTEWGKIRGYFNPKTHREKPGSMCRTFCFSRQPLYIGLIPQNDVLFFRGVAPFSPAFLIDPQAIAHLQIFQYHGFNFCC